MKILSKIAPYLTCKLPAVVFASTVLSFLYCCPLTASQEKYTVKQDGTGDFASISEAVAAVPSNSTLILSEGIYNEQVMIIDKTIHLEGVDREKWLVRKRKFLSDTRQLWKYPCRNELLVQLFRNRCTKNLLL